MPLIAPQRHLHLMLGHSVADPAHQIRITETFHPAPGESGKVELIHWADSWRTRFITWVIQTLLKPRGVYGVVRVK